MKLGLDVDGVLADFAETYLKMANKQFGHPLDPNANPVWDFNIPPGQAAELWKQIRGAWNFWLDLKPVSKESLALYDEAHTLIFITSRVSTGGDTPEKQTAQWLQFYKQVDTPTVLVVDHWHEKERLIKHLGLNAFIDDKVETVLQLREHGHNCYVFDQPWNRVPALSDKRVKSVAEFVDAVEHE